jgi:endonuclease/exonuclease/phosphatase family metal-dependent hydrolase
MQSDYDLVGCKFHHITEIIRRRQVAQLIAVESAARLPTLVTGDMNTDHCWFPGKWFWVAEQKKPAITFPSTAESLDHCTALGPTAWEVEGFHVSHIDMSDHYPVSWLLRILSF